MPPSPHTRAAGGTIPELQSQHRDGLLILQAAKCCLQNKQFRWKKISTGTPPAARVISPHHNLWASPQAIIPRSFRALFWIGRLSCACRLPASTLAGTVRRCRRRISETYRTYGTYRTKADRMANFFSADLLWCGSRPSIQRMKKSFDYTSSASHRSPMSQMSNMSSQK